MDVLWDHIISRLELEKKELSVRTYVCIRGVRVRDLLRKLCILTHFSDTPLTGTLPLLTLKTVKSFAMYAVKKAKKAILVQGNGSIHVDSNTIYCGHVPKLPDYALAGWFNPVGLSV